MVLSALWVRARTARVIACAIASALVVGSDVGAADQLPVLTPVSWTTAGVRHSHDIDIVFADVVDNPVGKSRNSELPMRKASWSKRADLRVRANQVDGSHDCVVEITA
jgi:hypothetical protein